MYSLILAFIVHLHNVCHTGHEISILIAYVSSERSGEPAQLSSLVIAFAARIHKVCADKDSDQNEDISLY